MQKYTFKFPFPPSINNYRVPHKYTGISIKSKRVRAWFKEVYYTTKRYPKPLFTTAPLFANLWFFPAQDHRERDIDNYTKAVFDVLQQLGVVANDYLIKVEHKYWGQRTKEACVLGTIEYQPDYVLPEFEDIKKSTSINLIGNPHFLHLSK